MSTAMILEWANTWQTSDAIPMFVECSSASEADVRVLFSGMTLSGLLLDCLKSE